MALASQTDKLMNSTVDRGELRKKLVNSTEMWGVEEEKSQISKDPIHM